MSIVDVPGVLRFSEPTLDPRIAPRHFMINHEIAPELAFGLVGSR